MLSAQYTEDHLQNVWGQQEPLRIKAKLVDMEELEKKLKKEFQKRSRELDYHFGGFLVPIAVYDMPTYIMMNELLGSLTIKEQPSGNILKSNKVAKGQYDFCHRRYHVILVPDLYVGGEETEGMWHIFIDLDIIVRSKENEHVPLKGDDVIVIEGDVTWAGKVISAGRVIEFEGCLRKEDEGKLHSKGDHVEITDETTITYDAYRRKPQSGG